jgi:very-short-patch-repair endonuclease
MTFKKIHTLSTQKEHRKELRSHLTPAEAALWKSLKNKQLLGRKFIRQHSIENYIADFYCPSENLIIELDGQGHFSGAAEYDNIRDERLKQLGYTVIRLENKLVFQDIKWVLDKITTYFKNG